MKDAIEISEKYQSFGRSKAEADYTARLITDNDKEVVTKEYLKLSLEPIHKTLENHSKLLYVMLAMMGSLWATIIGYMIFKR